MMHASLDPQRALVAEFLRPLGTLCPLSRLHQDREADRAGWDSIVALGWLGVNIPEALGGIGLGVIEEALMFKAFGRHLMSPCASATVIAASIAAKAGDAPLVTRLLDGRMIATFGFTPPGSTTADSRSLTLVAPHAGDLIVTFGASSLLLSTVGASRRIDESHWFLPLESARTDTVIAETSDPDLRARAELIIAAQLAGIAGATTGMAVDYAGIRVQFGRPISAFQAVKHHCATMAMLDFGARHLVTHAAGSLARRRDDAILNCGAALNFALRAARHNSGSNIQIHGGMGFSDEGDAHLFLKHAILLDAVVGGLSSTRRRLLQHEPAS